MGAAYSILGLLSTPPPGTCGVKVGGCPTHPGLWGPHGETPFLFALPGHHIHTNMGMYTHTHIHTYVHTYIHIQALEAVAGLCWRRLPVHQWPGLPTTLSVTLSHPDGRQQ